MSQLKVNSIIPVAGVPTGGGGGIIQVQNTTLKTGSSLSLTQHAFNHYSGIDVSLTPTSSSSKILISGQVWGEGSAQDSQFQWKLMRSIGGGSNADIDCTGTGSGNRPGLMGNCPTGYYGGDNSSTETVPSWSNVLDSPGTTSEVTYKFFMYAIDNGSTFYFNRTKDDSNGVDWGRGVSFMTIMEVSA